MSTRIAIQRELCRLLYAGVHDPIDGTNTSAVTTTITDTAGNLNYSTGDVNAFDRKYVYVVQAADAGARGESRVIEAGWTLTGSLTIDPAITGLVSGDLYIISDDPPALIQQNLNRVVRSMYEETFWPLSLHVMGNDANDMEPSTIATDYSATNGTRATESTIVFHGAQSLKLTTTAAGGYANTGNVDMAENRTLRAAVACSVTQGDDSTFRVWNVTGAASIDTATTDEPAWHELVISFTVPDNSEQLDFRFIGDGNGDVAYYDDFQLWAQGWAVYSLPSWITRREQVVDVRYWPLGRASEGTNAYIPRESGSQPLLWDFETVDRRADQPLRVRVQGATGRPFVVALRGLGELTSDTASTPADLDDVVAWTIRLMEAGNAPQRSDIIKQLKMRYFGRPVRRAQPRVACG